jgi:hypothetical protein
MYKELKTDNIFFLIILNYELGLLEEIHLNQMENDEYKNL